jgi:hypothetical protein
MNDHGGNQSVVRRVARAFARVAERTLNRLKEDHHLMRSEADRELLHYILAGDDDLERGEIIMDGMEDALARRKPRR